MEHIPLMTIIIAISVFLVSILVYWRIMSYYSKKEMGKAMTKQWSSRLYFWQGAIFTGTAVTFLVLFILKSTNF